MTEEDIVQEILQNGYVTIKLNDKASNLFGPVVFIVDTRSMISLIPNKDLLFRHIKYTDQNMEIIETTVPIKVYDSDNIYLYYLPKNEQYKI